MYFYYFFCSGAWRKKSRWRAIWRDMKRYVLATAGVSLLLHIYILPFVPLLLLLVPMAYYLFQVVRPSVYYTWELGGQRFFCAVYYDGVYSLGKNGVLISGNYQEIVRIEEIRRCKNLDEHKTLLVKLASNDRYMLYNAAYVNGLSVGRELRSINLAQGDSCFIIGSTICFVMNSGDVFFMPQVEQYKVMMDFPECVGDEVSYVDYFTGDAPKSVWQTSAKGELMMNFTLDYPYACYLAVQQTGGTQTLLRMDMTCRFIRQVLRINGAVLPSDFFAHSA